MGDSLEQDFGRRNGSPLRSSPDTALRRIPETETLGPFRASES
jgi:hypothetical protein